jgi:hypothetical protein
MSTSEPPSSSPPASPALDDDSPAPSPHPRLSLDPCDASSQCSFHCDFPPKPAAGQPPRRSFLISDILSGSRDPSPPPPPPPGAPLHAFGGRFSAFTARHPPHAPHPYALHDVGPRRPPSNPFYPAHPLLQPSSPRTEQISDQDSDNIEVGEFRKTLIHMICSCAIIKSYIP